MRIDILTLFPEMVDNALKESIIGRARAAGLLDIRCHNIRDYTLDKHGKTDDYPYGGGRGAVMTADPLYRCWEAICDEAGGPVHTIYMSPCGHTFKQADAIRLSQMENIIIVCGHYEGIDQRFIDECVDEEISLGDFVLTGGEIAAMAITDAVCRMVPGVLADAECFEDESHFNGLLEYPQYTRPAVWHGREVPQILLSGNHEKVRQWRRKQSLRRTLARRPDMYEKLDLSSKQDKKLLKEMAEEDASEV
jgi:tRNA (guanine37-N1)-methyltransferase